MGQWVYLGQCYWFSCNLDCKIMYWISSLSPMETNHILCKHPYQWHNYRLLWWAWYRLKTFCSPCYSNNYTNKKYIATCSINQDILISTTIVNLLPQYAIEFEMAALKSTLLCSGANVKLICILIWSWNSCWVLSLSVILSTLRLHHKGSKLTEAKALPMSLYVDLMIIQKLMLKTFLFM